MEKKPEANLEALDAAESPLSETDYASCREAGLLTTGEMARLSGSTLRTVRFYEEEGLIKTSVKTCGGHRMFEHKALERLTFILDLREAGLSLDDIKRLFELKARASTAQGASAEMSAMLLKQIDDVQAKITKLERLRSELGRMVEAIRDCGTCDEPKFQERCGDCTVMKQCGLPRVMKVLWK